jgi:uncharacterized protein YjbI with pentapeptide repeats
MKTKPPHSYITYLKFCCAGLLAAVKLEKLAGRFFFTTIWNESRLSSRDSIKYFWRLAFGMPFVLLLVIQIELSLSSSVTVPETASPQSTINIPQAPSDKNRKDSNPKGDSPQLKEDAVGMRQCSKMPFLQWFYCSLTKSELLKLFETFAIAIALITYSFDKSERREQRIQDDWTLIDAARGSETSGARYRAILRLAQEKENLNGLDAVGADLRNICLAKAELNYADLRNANLLDANMAGIKLNKANLQNTTLEKVDMSLAELHYADLRGANLKNSTLCGAWLGAAKLHRANLRDSSLIKADLRGARFHFTTLKGANLRQSLLKQTFFEEVDFEGVDLSESDIEGATFVKCTNLSLSKIQSAYNWGLAKFDELTLPECAELARIKKIKHSYGTLAGNDSSEKCFKLTEDLRNIENLMDQIRSRRIRNLQDPEIASKMDELYLSVSEFQDLQALLVELEDLGDENQKKLDDLLQGISSGDMVSQNSNG